MRKILTTSFILLTVFNSAFAQKSDTIIGRSYRGPDSNNVYTFVEQNPEFPGGDGELTKFIQKEFQYPEEERKNKIQGNLIARFVIETDGTLSNIQVIRSVSPGLDSEAVRVIKQLPEFIPGRQQDKPVKTYFNLPFKLRL